MMATNQTHWAVLMLAYGGPDSLEDVEPYLLDVRGGRETPPELVEEIRERYARIGGKSPLLEITRRQAAALEQKLNEHSGGGYRVYVGMRHWTPYIREAVEQARQDGYQQAVALCMAPYYSRMSIGAYAEKLRQAVEETRPASGRDLDVHLIQAWNEHPGFVQALAQLSRQALERFPTRERETTQVVFTAHSLPEAIMKQGDPYAEQFEQTSGLVAHALGLPKSRWQTAYQSAGASAARWLGPTLEETLDRLAGDGVRSVMVAPIGFVADHVEILYDIDMEAQEHAEGLGIHLERAASSNDYPDFIAALADIVEQKVQEQTQENM